MKVNHNISLDPDISQVVEEKMRKGEICLSRFLNNILRDRFREDLKKNKE